MDDARRTYHRLKLRMRRKVRKQKRQVEDMTLQADDSLNKHVFRRIGRLYSVRRFVAGWVLLLLFAGLGAVWQVRSLDGFYLKLAPTTGGVYREGMIGSFTNANPLFAVEGADIAVSKLVFPGLFKVSPEGKIESDIAAVYDVEQEGKVVLVRLRTDVRWHDGTALTADDVIFTYSLIQNPDTKSPLLQSWQDVQITKIDQYTVRFELPNILSSFLYSINNGIVPKHILENVEPADLRSSAFNTVNPIGAGPFTYKSVEVLGNDVKSRQEKVTLEKSDIYYGKKPVIDGVILRTFRDEDRMIRAFEQQEITAMAGLKSVDDRLLEDETVQLIGTPLSSQVMAFFNTGREPLSSKPLRQALIRATDTATLRQSIGYQLPASDSPFLKSHFSYEPTITQLGYKPSEVSKLLDEAGWKKAEDGLLKKNGKPLKLRLVSQSLTEYATVVREIQEQWGALGITVDAILQPEGDIQSGAIVNHEYDVLLYGISLGADPDVFAYWHSSQADPRLKTRLNLSEYKNKTADAALESGRTRIDEDLRKIKYESFLRAWRQDAPAIALYQPRFVLVTRGAIEGYKQGQFNSPSDRFYSISEWQVRREKTIK